MTKDKLLDTPGPWNVRSSLTHSPRSHWQLSWDPNLCRIQSYRASSSQLASDRSISKNTDRWLAKWLAFDCWMSLRMNVKNERRLIPTLKTFLVYQSPHHYCRTQRFNSFIMYLISIDNAAQIYQKLWLYHTLSQTVQNFLLLKLVLFLFCCKKCCTFELLMKSYSKVPQRTKGW